MATTYTPLIRAAQMTTGDPAVRNAWGPIANAWMVVAEQAIMGNATINIAGLTTYSLSVANNAADQSRLKMWNFSGALAADCTVTVPGIQRVGWAQNGTTGGFNVILTTGGGTTITIQSGKTYFYTCDGSNLSLISFATAGLSALASCEVGTSTTGRIAMLDGGTHPGILAFYDTGGTRVGYAGFWDGSTNFVLEAENGMTGWKVLQNFTVDGTFLMSAGTKCAVQIDTDATGTIYVNSQNPPNAPFTAIVANLAQATSVYAAWQFGGVTIGSITVAGGGTGVAFNTVSDATLKDHDRFMEGDGAVAILQCLQPRWFRWKANPEGEPEPGFFAQQVAESYPWAVTEATEATETEAAKPWQMDQAKLMPVVVAALQHTEARLQEALARIEALERRAR